MPPLTFVFPSEEHRDDVLSFYREMKENGDECIGCGQAGDYDRFLSVMRNRRAGQDLPDGWVQENFYLCYAGQALAGVFSLKRELTDFLLHYGGHIGYAVRPSMRGRGIATAMLKQGGGNDAGTGLFAPALRL